MVGPKGVACHGGQDEWEKAAALICAALPLATTYFPTISVDDFMQK